MNNKIMPPVAKKVPVELTQHGDVRIDNYYWMRDRENPEVIAYLEAENAYTEQVMTPHKSLEDELFDEIKARIKEDDESVPYKLNGYYYYSKHEEGKGYAIHCRKKGSLDAEEEILLDVNQVAEGHDFCSVGGLKVSEQNDMLAYAVDNVGRRIYTICFKNLISGVEIEEKLEHTTGNIAWAADNKTLFYTTQDEETLRSNKVWKHRLGTSQEEDELIFEETDEKFTVAVMRSKSREYIFINSSSTLSSEWRFVESNDPDSGFRLVQSREHKHEYGIDHYQDKFYVLTNWQAKNFRLMEAPIDTPSKEYWTELIPHRSDVLLEGIEIFAKFMVLEERSGGLSHLRVMEWEGENEHYIDFGEETYTAWTGANYDFDTPILRYGYNSLTTPASVYDYNMETREKILLKQQEVLGAFNSEDYHAERIYAIAQDGVKVPISLVYKKGFERNGEAPLYLTGYGAYGFSYDPYFSSIRLSLLDRGFVFAIAHIRGGEDMGRAWYEDGKMLKKKNTFSDFIACAEHLIAEKYTSSSKLAANGGSAGGLLMGAVMNMRPELFKVIVAEVPFVDVVSTMLDESIPLTVGEYDEWGNPNDPKYYEYIKSYSPYDQLETKDYPHTLVTSGLHDSQVQYWEPTKWVAKLREMKTDNNMLLLKTNMTAGHGGASGRYEMYREVAFEYAFILSILTK
ncbi:S9 family peptidase [Limibacter armeniacum]|uniref:S9 family peptidase n=1 Tax=Limibacter armeniacum TaxID=466084 RepID=UPI002FE52821